ncbi:plasmid mobilization relaxosome protein MobC [Algoriphagus sp.]|uniref:plasmid mobilization relaxosome protein MobC n=1 Tax=Algoriphagus sp. TaxID=1872435 RepID=UPI003F702B28
MEKKRENLSWVSVRLKPEIYTRLKEESQSLKMSLSQLIRMKLSSEETKIIDLSGLLNSIEKLVSEQARVNNNINQLAKHANTYRDKISPSVFKDHTMLMSKHIEHRDFMNKLLKQIYQAIR